MKAYQLGRRGSRRWSDPTQNLLEVTRDLRQRIVGSGPFRLKLRGDEDWSAPRDIEGTMARVGQLLRSRDVGESIWVKPESGVIRVIRIVDVGLAVPDFPPTAHPNLRPIWEGVYARWHIISWGICNCRHIAGSSAWSYHSYCQAWDIHGTDEQMQGAHDLIEANRSAWNVVELLWHVPNHYDHVHVAVEPVHDMHATPPCAR